MSKYRVLIDCDDETGLVYKISEVFFNSGLNIDKNDEFVDIKNKHFFMRSVVSGDISRGKLLSILEKALPNINIQVISPAKKNIIIFVTKESHVIGDLLIRNYSESLNANILGVVSNHNILKPFVDKFDIPFFYIPVNNLTREEHEGKILELISGFDFDYIVLAKYMRILTPSFIENLKNKIINIHHSFLPAFIGANPYKQAYKRGVKIIGATAHIVTDDLDDGPIISQNIININHTDSWISMKNKGQDVEKIVLATGLKLLLSDKIFIYKNKTVIF